MKTILITQKIEFNSDTNQRMDCLDQRWIKFLSDCNYISLLVPNNMQALLKIIELVKVDGIILSGGNDLDIFGGGVPERDLVERFLIEYGINNQVPVLGICRGMQIIQQYFDVPLHRIEGHVGSHFIDSIYGTKKVNSYHNYGSRDTISDLQVLARSGDGIVECFIHSNRLVMGIMWHPEREDEQDVEFTKGLIMRFMSLEL